MSMPLNNLTPVTVPQAPEAVLYRKFGSAADVWSFGCLMHEMWSAGEVCLGSPGEMDVFYSGRL